MTVGVGKMCLLCTKTKYITFKILYLLYVQVDHHIYYEPIVHVHGLIHINIHGLYIMTQLYLL